MKEVNCCFPFPFRKLSVTNIEWSSCEISSTAPIIGAILVVQQRLRVEHKNERKKIHLEIARKHNFVFILQQIFLEIIQLDNMVWHVAPTC